MLFNNAPMPDQLHNSQATNLTLLYNALLVFIIVLLAWYGTRFIINAITNNSKYEKESNIKSKSKSHGFFHNFILINSVSYSVRFVMILLGFTYIVDIFVLNINTNLKSIILKTQEICIVILLAWLAFRIIDRFESYLINRLNRKEPKLRKINRDNAATISRILYALIIVLVAITTMQMIGINTTTIFAISASIGVAVSFAVRDIIMVFFGTLTLYFDKPFVIGDAIRLQQDKGDVIGMVENIGWRVTTIRSFHDEKLTYIPNIQFVNVAVENLDKATYKQSSLLLKTKYENEGELTDFCFSIREGIRSSVNKNIDNDTFSVVDEDTVSLLNVDTFFERISSTFVAIRVSFLILNIYSEKDILDIKRDMMLIITKVATQRKLWFAVSDDE